MPTVLIVDDDKFTRTVLETAFAENQAFADLDIETRTADDGAQGLTEFLKHGPDVVITDLLMPNVDGWELCRAIRSEPSGQHVHLIAISGVSRDASVEKKLGDELDAAFFAKPYQMREMIEHIAQLLSMDARGEDSREVAVPPPRQDLQPCSGDLSERPLPAVLLDFLEARATGHLTIKRGRITKVVELVVGHPYSVSSTARDETLGHFLTTFGVITAEQHRQAVRRAAAKKERVSTALVGLGYVSPEDMVTRLTMHVCYRLVQSLRWPDGSWQFQPQDSPAGSPRGNPIDMTALILQGMRHSASMDRLPERIAQLEKRPMTLNPRGRSLILAIRQYLDPRVAEVWRDEITVAELLAAGVDASELFVTLDALQCCEALDVGPVKKNIVYDSAAEATLAVMTGAAFGQPSTRDTGDFSVEELSRAIHTRQAARSNEGNDPGGTQLYDALFADMGSTMVQGAGELPIELPDEEIQRFDSGIIDVSEISSELRDATTDSDNKYARRLLLKEYLRVQGTDHYRVLNVAMTATPAQLSAALAERKSKFSLEWFARYELGRDYAKVEEIHATYDLAFQVLADDDKRQAYDRALTGDDSESNEPGMAAEMAFHAGWDLLQHGSYRGAIAQLSAAVNDAPDEADYHAALGWAHYLEGGRTAHAADLARPHLNQGLTINPDHAASHEYKGIIDAEVGTDEAEAIFHLERAVDADPARRDALEKLEVLWHRRGEWRALERQYRKAIYRVGGSNPELELELWLRLGELCKDQLGRPDDARIAYHSAARLAPEDPRVRAGLQGGGGGDADSFADGARFLRQRWRREPSSPQPGIELMRLALEAEHPDPAFMAASALVARDQANDQAREFFERYRPRFVIRAQRTFATSLWPLLRHPLDSSELGALFQSLAPVIENSFPMHLDDLEVDESMEVSNEDLPEPFARVRVYVAHMLGVSLPRVYLRSDFGHQVHVGAVAPPVLLAGEEVLTSTERLELAFRLGRAMTFLSPGRTFAGSRPARMLKGAVLAVFASMQPQAQIPDPDGYATAVTRNLARLPPKALTRIKALVAHQIQRSQSLNLSQWSRALGRTADRMGMILCGDLPAAVRFTRESGSSEAVDDLIDYAVGGNCWKLRDELGLSIAV